MEIPSLVLGISVDKPFVVHHGMPYPEIGAEPIVHRPDDVAEVEIKALVGGAIALFDQDSDFEAAGQGVRLSVLADDLH